MKKRKSTMLAEALVRLSVAAAKDHLREVTINEKAVQHQRLGVDGDCVFKPVREYTITVTCDFDMANAGSADE